MPLLSNRTLAATSSPSLPSHHPLLATPLSSVFVPRSTRRRAHAVNRRKLVNKYLGLPPDATPSKQELASFPRMKLLHAQQAAKNGIPLLPKTRFCCTSSDMLHAFGPAAQIPLSSSSLARMSLGWLSLWANGEGLRAAFDASQMDGTYMPAPVGASPPASEVPLLLLYTKDEFFALGMNAGLGARSVSSKAAALERIQHLLPVRGVLDTSTRMRLATAFYDAYASKVMPGASTREVYVECMQDLWQYHTCTTVATHHAAAVPGQTYLSMLAYEAPAALAAKMKVPHGLDVSLIFGDDAGGMIHKPGKDFEGMTAIMQAVIGNFARTGDPNSEVRGSTRAWCRMPLMLAPLTQASRRRASRKRHQVRLHGRHLQPFDLAPNPFTRALPNLGARAV